MKKQIKMDGKSIAEIALEAAIEANFDKTTLHRMQTLAFPEIKNYSPQEIKNLRLKSRVSQGVWSKLLNVNLSTSQKWERGVTQPEGAAIKLLNMIERQGISVLM